jgi:hypothetical protein
MKINFNPLKILRIISKILLIFLIICIVGLSYSFGVATYENIAYDNKIKEFKKRAVYETTIDKEVILLGKKHTQRINYYKIPRIYEYELSDKRNVFLDSNKLIPYQDGDLYVTVQTTFPEVKIFDGWMGYNFGGHAAVYSKDIVYESVGAADSAKMFLDLMFGNYDDYDIRDLPRVSTSSNYFTRYANTGDEKYGYYYRNNALCLRVKNVDSEQLVRLNEYLESVADKDNEVGVYNFAFFFNMKNRYYCSDLVSRAYQYAISPKDKDKLYSKVLNYDGFITSIYDIVLSNEVYYTFYYETHQEVINDVDEWVIDYYYLEDIE